MLAFTTNYLYSDMICLSIERCMYYAAISSISRSANPISRMLVDREKRFHKKNLVLIYLQYTLTEIRPERTHQSLHAPSTIPLPPRRRYLRCALHRCCCLDSGAAQSAFVRSYIRLSSSSRGFVPSRLPACVVASA